MLDPQGYVAEGTGENIFVVKQRRRPHAADVGAILAGITRDTAIQLLREQGVEVREEPIARDELYTADEVFLTGTAAEITPVREIDHRKIGRGEAGPVTRAAAGVVLLGRQGQRRQARPLAELSMNKLLVVCVVVGGLVTGCSKKRVAECDEFVGDDRQDREVQQAPGGLAQAGRGQRQDHQERAEDDRRCRWCGRCPRRPGQAAPGHLQDPEQDRRRRVHEVDAGMPQVTC